MIELQTRKRYLVETCTDLNAKGEHTGIWRNFSYYASRSMTAAEIEAAQKAENERAINR